jgi:hypothetical protein
MKNYFQTQILYVSNQDLNLESLGSKGAIGCDIVLYSQANSPSGLKVNNLSSIEKTTDEIYIIHFYGQGLNIHHKAIRSKTIKSSNIFCKCMFEENIFAQGEPPIPPNCIVSLA